MKTKEELLKLYNLPLDELLAEAKKYTFKEFEFCSLISARTGKCSQNCKYCSQSTHYNTDIYTHPLVSVDEVVSVARESKENGAINFAIVTSGKTPDEAKDFNELLKMIKEVNALGLKSCASIGICSKELANKLKEAGLDLPQTTELLFKLSQNGIKTDKGVLSVSECADFVAKLLNSEAN
jgi:biotin synthase